MAEAGRSTTDPVVTAAVGEAAAKLAPTGLAILQLLNASPLPDSWINRRVVHMEFLDARAVRWRSSIDFVVPENAPPIAGETRLVPVASLLKGGTVAAFDLRDEGGNALSLPSSRWASRRLGSALSYWAADVLGRALPDSVEKNLADIVSSDARQHAAFEAFAAAGQILDARRRHQDARAELAEASRLLRLPYRLADIRERWARQRRWERAQDALAHASSALDCARQRWNAVAPSNSRDLAQHLMADELFRAVLTELALNFVVLAPTTSPPGTHRIIKLRWESAISFQRPEGRFQRIWQSLGWRCWPVEVLIGGRVAVTT